MLKKIKKKEEYIKNYIGDNYNKCLYLYLDYIKYGLNNKNIKFWLNIEQNEIKSIILKYYNGMHIFSKNHDCNYDEIIQLILKENPSIICAERILIENISKFIKNTKYITEYGWVRVLSEKYICDNSIVEKATPNNFKEISELIINDHMGEFYNLNELISQMKERDKDNFGRQYIIKQNNKIISSASTTAEIDGIAVLSHVITDKKYRGKGLATKVCSKLCNDLISEGKKIYLINYTDESIGLYDKLGFKISCEIGKIYLKDK